MKQSKNIKSRNNKIRFGLCCIFLQEPIKFRQITAKTLQSISRTEQLLRLSEICLHNVLSLYKSLQYVSANNIGAFRILSPLFPRYTHPKVAYTLNDLPAGESIKHKCDKIRKFRQNKDIRLSFHPDQFNVLSSPRPEVIRNTFRELEYQGMLADLFDAEVINLHAGGVYGNKEVALRRLEKNIGKLPDSVRSRISLENDDISFTPADLLPICKKLKIPIVYDVHHHRCNPDEYSVEEATARVLETWNELRREPYFHISSPKNGWQKGSPKPHADYINPADFPSCWQEQNITVDVEAKAKELAVLRLMKNLSSIS
ncbi:UV DNA damage repair endonuclease UvsE [Thermodesulfobacteriota bacterium]